MTMEDGLDLLRAWLRPEVTAGVALPSEAGSAPEWESTLHASLARARAFGARDVDVRVGVDQKTGRFTEVIIEDLARGVSRTRLRAWLSQGTAPLDPKRDRTLPDLRPPLGPPGFILSRFRTHLAGQTIESWSLPDGTWELHLHSESVPGNREIWYLPGPGPEETLERLRASLARILSPLGPLRVRLQGEPLRPGPAPGDPPLHVIKRRDDATSSHLELLSRPDGALTLSHQGLVFFRGPCPVPHVNFFWDGIYHPGHRNPGDAVARDLEAARRELGESLVDQLTRGETGQVAWRRFLAGHRDPAWRRIPLGKDLRGRAFNTLDLVEGTALAVSPVVTLPSVGPEFFLLDERAWPADLLLELRRQETPGARSQDEPGQAACRFLPDRNHPCARWPGLWRRESEREPRLAFERGLILCELHRPAAAAWPFFPVQGSPDLVRLRTLSMTWDLRGALWVAVNHPLVTRLAARCGPEDAVRLLSILVLLSQDQDPVRE